MMTHLILTIISATVLLIEDFIAIIKLVTEVKFMAFVTLMATISNMLVVKFVALMTESYYETCSYCNVYSLS